MNINDFEEEFYGAVLSRAEDYFRRGHVISLEKCGGEWAAAVEGSRLYTVIVRLDGNEITYSKCNCPYEDGFCKHEGAVYLAIRERLRSDEDGENTSCAEEKGGKKKKKKKAEKAESIDDMLAVLGENELRAVLSEILHSDERLSGEFRMNHGDKKHMTGYVRSVIKASVRKVKQRGYVEYDDIGRMIEGAEEVLDRIDGLLEEGDALTAVPLCIVLLEEMMSELRFCDDSNGYCSEVISGAIDRLGDSVLLMVENGIKKKKAEKMFDLMYDHAIDPLYEDILDWRMDIFHAVLPLCCHKRIREKMEAYLASSSESKTASSFSRDYNERCKLYLRLELMEAFDEEEAVTDLINRNLDNTDFRRKAIEIALERKEFEKAIRLCEDGEKQNEHYPGIMKSFKHCRFRAYEGSGDAEKQRELAKELVLDGDFDYYDKLKSLFTNEEWPEVLEEILERTKPNAFRYYGGEGIYMRVIVAEEMNERLLEACKENTGAIIRYSSLLLPMFPEETDEIFRAHIYERANASNTRGQYRNVCSLICLYERTFAKKATDIKKELAELYKKRPAFLDELRKI